MAHTSIRLSTPKNKRQSVALYINSTKTTYLNNVYKEKKIQSLSLILDNKISWNEHELEVTDKAKKAPMVCRNFAGNHSKVQKLASPLPQQLLKLF